MNRNRPNPPNPRCAPDAAGQYGSPPRRRRRAGKMSPKLARFDAVGDQNARLNFSALPDSNTRYAGEYKWTVRGESREKYAQNMPGQDGGTSRDGSIDLNR